MKKLVSLAALLFITSSLVGCNNSTSENDKKDKDENSKQSEQQESTQSKKNAPMDEITEDDIVNKTEENLKGQDVIKYELKDGSIIIGTEKEDDINKINEAIRNSNEKESKSFE